MIICLVRGLPGSGKSTFVEKTLTGFTQIEADQYFIDELGNYNFNSMKLKEAHEWCYNRTEENMKLGQLIAVSNTFTQEWEMKEYYELASKYNYTIISIIIENRHNGVSIHDVNEETLDRMENRFSIKLR